MIRDNRRSNGMRPASGGQKINQNELGRMINEASQKLGSDGEAIKNAINSGKLENVTSKLSPSDAQRLNAVMQDEEKMKQILSTPQAQALIKKLLG